MSKFIGKGLIFSLSLALILGGTGNLFAGEVVNAKDKVKVTVYGQVNRVIMNVDDGNESYLNHVDNDLSSTRFGFKAKAKGSDSLTAGANMEWEYQGNESNKVSQTTHSTDPGLKARKLEAYLKTNIGTFTLGKGSTASDGTSEVDLSGSSAAGYSGMGLGTGYLFFDETANALTGTDVGDVINNLDGNSRKDRFRYDTPSFGGFKISASTWEASKTVTGAVNTNQHGAAYDLALRYGGKFGDAVKLKAALAYSKYPSTDATDADDSLLNGSISVFVSGFSVTAATGNMSLTNVTVGQADSQSTLYGKLGYMGEFFSSGPTAFALDYGKYDEFSGIKDDEASTYALYAVQHMKAWSSELYGGYRIYKLEDRASTNEKFNDINTLYFGMRIKF